MKLIRKLFAEKILKFYEGTDSGIRIIKTLPVIKDKIKDTAFAKKSKSRIAVGITVQIFFVIWEFIKKFLFITFFMHLPFIILSRFFPLIDMHENYFMIYVFVILSTICGSLANTTIFAMGDRDYLMIRVMLVSPYMNFLGKLIYKMVTDFIFNFIVLIIFRVSVFESLMLSLITLFARPIGEMFAIISFDHFHGLYENRNVFNGSIMAICVLIAYTLPILNKSVSENWLYAVHPIVLLMMAILGAGAMFYLWWYKYYRRIIRAAMHKKRDS